MLCEMCSGQDAAFLVEVEGSRLSVCEKCSRFGKVVGKLGSSQPKSRQKEPDAPVARKLTESIQVIRSDYAKVMKEGREKLGLTQEDFAKRLMERESTLHKIESGHMKPDIALARKLEKFLKVTLVEQLEVEPAAGDPGKRKKGEGMTIGDFMSPK
jgi:putative transcription factor